MNITFILRDNTKRVVQFFRNETVLQVAERNNINLHGHCEGFGICGGCHVFVETQDIYVSEITEKENDCLDTVRGVAMNSRLACQMILDERSDGLVVKLV